MSHSKPTAIGNPLKILKMLSWVNWEAFMQDMADTSEIDAMNVAYQQFTITMLSYKKL